MLPDDPGMNTLLWANECVPFEGWFIGPQRQLTTPLSLYHEQSMECKMNQLFSLGIASVSKTYYTGQLKTSLSPLLEGFNERLRVKSNYKSEPLKTKQI